MPSSHQPTAIIFDFDGTLADSFLVAIQVFYELTQHAPLPDEDISRLRSLNARQLLHELKIPIWKVPFLVWRARRMLHRELDQIDLVPGVVAAVKTLAAKYRLFILSSNSSDNVRSILRRYKIEKHFADMYGSAQPLHKERGLKRLLQRNGIPVSDAWYVGDETRDMEAAHRLHMPVMAVSWGYNNIAALERHNPTALVFSPEELVAYFAKETR